MKLRTSLTASRDGSLVDATDENLICDAAAAHALMEAITAWGKHPGYQGGESWVKKRADEIMAGWGFDSGGGCVMEWMPIETAPRDGTRIMLGNKHATWEAEYRSVYQSGYRPDNPWESMMLNMDHLPRENRYGPPTHWMPLPPPPTDRRTPEQPE